MEYSVKKIADYLNGKIEGDSSVTVSNISKIDNGEAGTLTFLTNPKYERYIYSTKASAILVNKDFTPEKEIDKTLIKVDDAYTALASLLNLYNKNGKDKKGIDRLAFIAKSTNIKKNVYVGPFAHIGDNVEIGNNVKIHPQVYIGDNVKIHDGTVLMPGVKIYHDCTIGKNCRIHAGVVIGSDGFGFAQDDKNNYEKVPQVGNVIIEDEVEIGANTTIDRATIGSTIIRKGVKLDNLIQIAHNVEIGENTVICAQAGIAGSTKIGKDCMIAGQVGIIGHLEIGNNVKIAAQSGVSKNIPDNKVVQGSPAFDFREYQKVYVSFRKLNEMRETIQRLEKEIKELKSNQK